VIYKILPDKTSGGNVTNMATTVYEASFGGELDSTVVVSTGDPGWHFIARAWMNYRIELWDSVGGFSTAVVQYEARLSLQCDGGTVYPYEFYGYEGGIIQEVWGAAAGSFSFTATIKVEQDGNDVKVTVTGSLGSFVDTFAGKLFVRVDPTEAPTSWGAMGNAGCYAYGVYVANVTVNPPGPNNYYGEVITVDNPTRTFRDGGSSEANWSDWDTLREIDETDYCAVSYNGIASITMDNWPPVYPDHLASATVKVAEKASDRYKVELFKNQLTLAVQSIPPTGVSISYLPTPDDDAEVSPQDTNFNIKYGAEDIAFSPLPDIIEQTTPAQSGTFYWVWYQVKYGGNQPDVEFTAPGTSGRRNFVRWDYTRPIAPGDNQTQESNILVLGELERNVVCDPHYTYNMQVVAPAINPSGYRWLYWDFLAGDHRIAKTQGFLLDADRTIIATYEEGSLPVLGIAQHFSGGILATDSGLTAGPDAGQHKIQRGTWSERFAVPDSADTIWANPYSTKSRTELIEGKTNVQTRFAESLDGDWQAAQEVEATYSCPYGIEALGFLYISAYKDGKQYLLRRQRSGEHTAMEAPLVIANSDEVAASLAFFPLQWALACAVQYNDDTKIYLSRDHGQSWSLKHTVAVLYPSLFCDDRLLWLVGYVDGVYGGAAGRVSVAAYHASSLALPESQALTIVGPSDAGRPAILRESGTWLVRTLAPRTTDWGDGEAAPSIVEYVSDNVGETWSKVGVHVV